MKRGDWAGALRGYLFGILGQPFQWGVLDCHTVILWGLDEMTQEKASSGWLGRWSDVASAIRVCREAGGMAKWLRQRGAVTVSTPVFGDVLIYRRVEGSPWRLGVPAWSMGLGLVMLPAVDSGVVIVPADAGGQVRVVLRIPLPCLP